jgi:hypothetical protein
VLSGLLVCRPFPSPCTMMITHMLVMAVMVVVLLTICAGALCVFLQR